MITCVAVVGQLNNPLYLRTFGPAAEDDSLKFHYMVHSALDAVEEKVLSKRAPNEVTDTYLGLLYPTEEFRIFGYITNTNVKFMIVVDDVSAKEDSLGKVFKTLHSSYVDTVSNPFYMFGHPLNSSTFDKTVRDLAAV